MPLLISHEISLHAGVDPEEFERFVQEQDYPTCPAFRSLLAFTVVGDAEVPGLYREFILVTDAEAFARDMDSKEFRRLEEKFGALAAVTSETVEDVVGLGYRATPDIDRKEKL